MNREYQACFIIKRYLSMGATDFSINNNMFKVIGEGIGQCLKLVQMRPKRVISN